jgi:hypothetical protein
MKKLSLILFCCFSYSLTAQETTYKKSSYSKKKIGWIKYNSKIDSKDFLVCDEESIYEYYQSNPVYIEGLLSIREYFQDKLPEIQNLFEKDGILLVRFVINCQGETGRFRAFFYHEDYKLGGENKSLGIKIADLISKMQKWISGKIEEKKVDSYQNIKFRIKQNKIVDIFF